MADFLKAGNPVRVAKQVLWRHGAKWLERRGLPSVAAVFERRAANAGDVVSLHAIARRALAKDRPSEALSAMNEAIPLAPGRASLWCTRGAAHRHLLDFAAARADYEQAIALDSGYVQPLSNLGEWHLAQGDALAAKDCLERALELAPDFFEARINHVAVLFELAEFDAALEEAEALVEKMPDSPEARVNLGNVLVHTGKAREAVKHFQRALELRPSYEEAHFNLAILIGSHNGLAEAIGYLERQIKIRGETTQRLSMLAAAHQAASHLGESERLCREVITRQPDNISAVCTLASVLSHGGDAAAALPWYQRILETDPSQSRMGSTVLFEMTYLPELSREVVFKAHRDWAEKYAEPFYSPLDFSKRDRSPARKLRLGYVSGDLLGHPVGFLFLDVLAAHDREQFEIVVFSMVVHPDDITEVIRGKVDRWEDIFLHSDTEAVEAIAEAEIDILIDLSGHTAFHRLFAFAQRVAPVQATWIGYFHSTGLTEIDYFLTDPHTTPTGGGQLFSETPIHLPSTRFCFHPPPYATVVGPQPVFARGHFTFGSFNRLPKYNDVVIATWAKILSAVPESRLVLKARVFKDEGVRERFIESFGSLGVTAERLELREISTHAQMFEEYNDIDLALDPFPFNGGMTTLEALWMGVPVLTLEGDTVVSRQSYSALANLGLTEALSCPSIDAYVARAVELAQHPEELAKIRAELRPRMQASPLCQPEQFTQDLEALYRRMWQAWCRGEKLPADA